MTKKKSFINREDPAFNFISGVGADPEESKTPLVRESSTPEESRTPPEGYYLNPAYIEKKTKRVQLLMKPSVHDKARSKASSLGMSLNDYINTLVEKDMEV